MKKLTYVLFFAIVLVFSFGISKANQYESASNLAIGAAAVRQEMNNMGGYNLRLNFSDIQTWWRNPGTTSVVYRQLSAGNAYVFIASGDNNASDVDIYVYDGQNNLVRRDQHTDRNAYAIFRANYSETYMIVIKLYSTFNGGPSHISYAMSYISR